MKQDIRKCLSLRTSFTVCSGLLVLSILLSLYAQKFGILQNWKNYLQATVNSDGNDRYQTDETTQKQNEWNQRLVSEQSTVVEKSVEEKEAGLGQSQSILKNDDRTVNELTRMLQDTLERDNNAVAKMTTRPCERFNYSSNRYPSHIPCIGAKCNKTFNRTLEERVKDLVLSPQYQLSSGQLNAILSLGRDVPVADIIIVSAVSSSHFNEMQMMFKNLHDIVFPNLINFRVVLFDLGLSPEERLKTEKNCRCQVITFDFSLFPWHIMRLMCYAWKPLMIRAMFARARKLVIWQDASVRWGSHYKVILQRAQMYGLQVLMTGSYKVTANTLHEMFEFMQERECLFEWVPEICNAVIIFRMDPFNKRAIVEPWCSCALYKSCMCPKDPAITQPCFAISPKRCHRFDQSAMTLLLGKLFYDQRYKIEIPKIGLSVKVKRGSAAPNYFVP